MTSCSVRGSPACAGAVSYAGTGLALSPVRKGAALSHICSLCLVASAEKLGQKVTSAAPRPSLAPFVPDVLSHRSALPAPTCFLEKEVNSYGLDTVKLKGKRGPGLAAPQAAPHTKAQREIRGVLILPQRRRHPMDRRAEATLGDRSAMLKGGWEESGHLQLWTMLGCPCAEPGGPSPRPTQSFPGGVGLGSTVM